MLKKSIFCFVIAVFFAAGCATAPKTDPVIHQEPDKDEVTKAAVITAVPTVVVKETVIEKETETPVPTAEPVKPKLTATPVKTPAPVKTVKAAATPQKTPVKKPATESERINEILEALKEKQKNRAAAKMNITIRTTYTEMGTSQDIKGEVRMKRPDKFMVKYTEPQEQYLYSDGKTIWVYTPAIKQVMKQSAEDAQVDTKMYIEMESSIEYYARASNTTMTEDAKYYNFKMLPKNKKELNFDEITVRILKAGLSPETMEMKYEGASVKITFSAMKNYTAEEMKSLPEFEDSVFDFKIPDNTEVIDASALMQGGI